MRNSLTALALVGLLFAVPAVAAEVPRGDAKFIKEASEGNLAEVKLGELAQQRAASDAVKPPSISTTRGRPICAATSVASAERHAPLQ